MKVPKDWYTHISSCLSRDNLNPIARMGKWRVLAFARLHPWFGWDEGLLLHFTLSKIVIYGKLVPPLPRPQSRVSINGAFGFCAASSLIWGEGGGGEEWTFAVPFYSVQDCSFRSALGALGASLCAWPKMSSSSGRELILTRTFWNRKNNFSPPF